MREKQGQSARHGGRAPLRMAVASMADPRSLSNWSGCSHFLLRALERDHGVALEPLGPLHEPHALSDRLTGRYHRARGRTFATELTRRHLRSFARQTAAKLRGRDYDCVLALGGHALAYLETDLPVYYFWDCTFEGNLEYPWFAELAPECIEAGQAMQRSVHERARMAFYASQWAVDSAVHTYGADPARTHIVPLAANIDDVRSEAEVEALIAARPVDELNLLFLGIDWLRKGGDLAVDVAEEMNRRGVRTVLHVVGCAPPADMPLPDFVRLHGFLDKRDAGQLAQLQALMGSAHFLIVPSVAEAFGAVFCEASAYGTPSLARRVGGVDSAVTDEVNGRLFDREDSADAYCDWLEPLWRDLGRYRALAHSSYRHFTARLTWKHVAGRLVDHIAEDLGR